MAVLRHPGGCRDGKNISRLRAPIDFVIICKNERNANKWIFDGRPGLGRKVHAPRIDAPRGTQKRLENRASMHAPLARPRASTECLRSVSSIEYRVSSIASIAELSRAIRDRAPCKIPQKRERERELNVMTKVLFVPSSFFPDNRPPPPLPARFQVQRREARAVEWSTG